MHKLLYDVLDIVSKLSQSQVAEMQLMAFDWGQQMHPNGIVQPKTTLLSYIIIFEVMWTMDKSFSSLLSPSAARWHNPWCWSISSFCVVCFQFDSRVCNTTICTRLKMEERKRLSLSLKVRTLWCGSSRLQQRNARSSPVVWKRKKTFLASMMLNFFLEQNVSVAVLFMSMNG